MSDNLAVWNKLSRTDPDHTKAFTRGGGFRGTAIKPIYTEMKMTETFGPCGSGWGFGEQHFQLVNCAGGEVAIFCWLTLWYRKEDGNPSEPIPGVGGDFVVKTLKGELRSDDEAFKKAATDALGNAMKHLGMSADVHMGRFDDNKYVDEVREEVRQAANGNGKPTPRKQADISANAAFKREEMKRIQTEINQIGSFVELDRYKREVLTEENMSKLGMNQFAVEQVFARREEELITLRNQAADPVEKTADYNPDKAEFVRNCHAIIEESEDEKLLLEWFNSSKQKMLRAMLLTPQERTELLARAMAKRETMLAQA